MSRQTCDKPLCQDQALVWVDGEGFYCELHAPADELRRF